jgi:UDP-N-acetylmuramoyl-tripeptide--D-alanyl-D-alanine ligase
MTQWEGLSLPVYELSGGATVVDGSAVVSARDAVDVLKDVRGRLSPDQRHIVVTGAVSLGGDSDYDDLEAFGAFIVRMNIALCVAVGPAARPIWASVGREGSWDGESQHVDTPEQVYAVVSEDIRPGDVFVVLCGDGENMTVVTSMLREFRG